jgi:hypothetical protein
MADLKILERKIGAPSMKGVRGSRSMPAGLDDCEDGRERDEPFARAE